MTERHNANRVLAIISGGMDSAVLLYDLKHRGFEVAAVSFDYGQRHSKELHMADALCETLGVTFDVVDIQSWAELIPGNALTDLDVDVPEGHYEDESMKQTVVPMRNVIMLTVATSIASARNIGHVAIGIHAGDHAVYPDCRPEFIDAFTAMSAVALEGLSPVGVMAPFVHKRKEDIAALGGKLEVPFEKTWSCYKGQVLHCGKCGTCVERKEAFEKAGLPDPTRYEDVELAEESNHGTDEAEGRDL